MMKYTGTCRKIFAVVFAFIMILSGIEYGALDRTYAAKAKKPAKVKLKSVKASGLKITAKWKKAKNARKYQVYVKIGTGKWKLNRMANISIAVMLIMLLISDVCPEFSYAAKAVKKPEKVKLLSAKRSGLKITLKWKKAKNTTKYQVYQKAGSGKWKLKKTLKKIKLTVSGTYGKTYSFKVRGINGKKKGAFSKVRKVTVPEKKGGNDGSGEEPGQGEDPAPQEKSDDEKAADLVIALIDSLPEVQDLTLNDRALVEDVRTEYLLLSEKARAFVPQDKLAELNALEASLAELKYEKDQKDEQDKQAANKVSAKIVSLYGEFMADELSYSDKDRIFALRRAYEELTDDQKSFVSKESTLSLLEEMEHFIYEAEEKINSNMAPWDRIAIDGMEFFRVTEHDGKTLLIASEAVSDEEGTVRMSFGESGLWRDSNVRAYLNSEFLESHQGISEIAVSTDIKTLSSALNGEKKYTTTSDRVFLPTLADIMGGSEYGADDYSYNGEIFPGLEGGRIIMMPGDADCWIRDPWISGTTMFVRAYMCGLWQDGKNVITYMTYNNYTPARNDEFGLRPAFWADSAKLSEVCDRVEAEEEGDELEIGMFTDWSFYGRGGFAYFSDSNPQVKVGEDLTLRMASNGTVAASNGQTANPGKPFPYEPVRVSTDGGRTWEADVYKTDYDGNFTCSFEKPGVYYLSAGPKFVRQGDTEPCIVPPVSVVEVSPGAIEEYRVRAVSGTTVRYSFGEVENAVSYEVAYKKSTETEWKTVSTDKTSVDVTGLEQGARYNFRVRAISESNYVPEGDPVKKLTGEYSEVSSVVLP